MKKTFISLLLLLLIMVPSCAPKKDPTGYTGEDDTEETTSPGLVDAPIDYEAMNIAHSVKVSNMRYYDGYIYNHSSSCPFMKYNVKTGNVSTVCQDPVCTHNTPSCPFEGSFSSFYIFDSTIYVNRKYSYFNPAGDKPIYEREFLSYNIETMKYTTLKKEVAASSYNEILKQIYMGDQRYYYDSVYDKALKKYVWQICRQDLKTKEITPIVSGDVGFDDTLSLTMKILFIINNRIYFTDSKILFSTDLDGNDKKVITSGNFSSNQIYTNGEYVFYGVPVPGNERALSIRRMNLDGTNDVDLEITIPYGYGEEWLITQNYIYYQSLADAEIKLSYVKLIPEEVKEITGREDMLIECAIPSDAIIRCDHDGNNKTIVYQQGFSEGECIYPFSLIAVGNYIYANYIIYIDNDGDGKLEAEPINCLFEKNSVIMRISVLDGSVEYININKGNRPVNYETG